MRAVLQTDTLSPCQELRRLPFSFAAEATSAVRSALLFLLRCAAHRPGRAGRCRLAYVLRTAAPSQLDERRLTPCDLLERWGCHRAGLWRGECGCEAPHTAPGVPLPSGPVAPDIPDLAALCSLPAAAVPCLRSCACAPTPALC